MPKTLLQIGIKIGEPTISLCAQGVGGRWIRPGDSGHARRPFYITPLITRTTSSWRRLRIWSNTHSPTASLMP